MLAMSYAYHRVLWRLSRDRHHVFYHSAQDILIVQRSLESFPLASVAAAIYGQLAKYQLTRAEGSIKTFVAVANATSPQFFKNEEPSAFAKDNIMQLAHK